jgi:hypothetical protein
MKSKSNREVKNMSPTNTTGKNVIVFKEAGRFGGWPANHGIWTWGNEIVVGFEIGYHESKTEGHTIDAKRPRERAQARTVDGGVTWEVEHPEAFAGGKTPVKCADGIELTHPDFAMKLVMTDNENAANGPSYFFYSYDRAKTWQGPFSLPTFGQAFIAPRTDYLVNGKSDCTLFLTAIMPTNGEKGARPFCARTYDGGGNWQFLSWIAPEPEEGFSIMPSSLRISKTRIISAIRRGATSHHWTELFASDDDGRNWIFVNDCTLGRKEKDHYATPHLLELEDGRICITYGFRSAPFGIRARLSSDKGLTWDDEIILRKDGGNWDLGYPRSAQRPDGKIVTIYYFNDDPQKERHIAATIWEPPTLSGKGGFLKT